MDHVEQVHRKHCKNIYEIIAYLVLEVWTWRKLIMLFLLYPLLFFHLLFFSDSWLNLSWNVILYSKWCPSPAHPHFAVRAIWICMHHKLDWSNGAQEILEVQYFFKEKKNNKPLIISVLLNSYWSTTFNNKDIFPSVRSNAKIKDLPQRRFNCAVIYTKISLSLSEHSIIQKDCWKWRCPVH